MPKKKPEFKPKTNTKLSTGFLPSPDQLVMKEDTVKVTLLLNKSSVDYFKKAAGKHSACYQAMIRALVDEYVKHYQGEV